MPVQREGDRMDWSDKVITNTQWLDVDQIREIIAPIEEAMVLGKME